MLTPIRHDTAMLGTAVTPIHILIIEPNGETLHWLVPLTKADAAADALATATRLFPSSRTELHWRRVFGALWAIVFISDSQQSADPKTPTASSTAKSRYLPDPDN